MISALKFEGSINRIVRNSVSAVDFHLPDIEADEIYIKVFADGYLQWFEKIPPEAYNQDVLIVEASLKRLTK